ncbi:glycosyltransferase family 2 protein [Flavobacterium branchiarum]|uniref:Glycosyltransferase family 2 protein n=1 Tax=Flavobacterium branchiarum TaxID=1114870 RepID=A0ABV5FP79_9FLAO|nr:glycosyltransferase family 2 protein [Flavobacterium branchiarum]MDN3671936.1 glycosyltransferase family 2 protein [Flavobacterium branchiarum]
MVNVTIIIPSYNHSTFLLDRLKSISNQTYKNWEAIIIDDQSTDNSVEIIRRFLVENPNFNLKSLIINDANSGSGYSSWQKGIELATTEYIWIAETDDYSESTFLEELATILDINKGVSLAFSGSNYVENNRIIYDSANRTKDLNVGINDYQVLDSSIFLDRMPFKTYITNGSSVLFRKPKRAVPAEVFNYRLCSDIFLWSHLLQNSSFVFLNENLNFFRRHGGSISSYLSKNKLEEVYHEKAQYLNYFKQTDKYIQFIEHYIKYYIWTHKNDFLNTSSIQTIQSGKKVKVLYFYKLIQFFVSKIFRK